MQETWVWSLGREDSLERGRATHSSILAWRIPWTEEPGELQSIELQRVRHDWSEFSHHHNPHYHFPGRTCAPALPERCSVSARLRATHWNRTARLWAAGLGLHKRVASVKISRFQTLPESPLLGSCLHACILRSLQSCPTLWPHRL